MSAKLASALVDRSPAWFGAVARSTYLIFLILPFAVALPISFSPLAVFPPTGFTTKWYGEFFNLSQFNKAWQVSLVLAFAAASVSLFIGSALALAASRYRFPGRDFLVNLTLSPLIVPGVATGVGLVFFFTQIGLVHGWSRLIIAHVIITVPYVVRVMVASLYGFERSIEEAAMNLGATEAKAFFTVTLPVVRPAMAAGFIFAFMASFENLPATIFVVQPGTYTLPVVLFGYVRDDFNPIVAVATVIMVLAAALLMWIANRVVGINRMMGLH